MPFFPNASGPVKIIKSEMTDVQGDYHHYDNSIRHFNTNSNNYTEHNVKNSHNNSSVRQEGNQTTHNNYTDDKTISITWESIRGRTTKDAQLSTKDKDANLVEELVHKISNSKGDGYHKHQSFENNGEPENHIRSSAHQQSMVGNMNREYKDMDVDVPEEGL